MKQTELPHTTERSKITSSFINDSILVINRRRRLIKILSLVLCLIIIVIIFIIANNNFSTRGNETGSLSLSNNRALEIEVLDGVGRTMVAQRMTDFLRSQGYDVVEMKKNIDGLVDRSYVLDRSGNLDAARKLATILDIPKDKVFQKIDRNMYLDITVVVGKDYSNLRAFQFSTKRSKH